MQILVKFPCNHIIVLEMYSTVWIKLNNYVHYVDIGCKKKNHLVWNSLLIIILLMDCSFMKGALFDTSPKAYYFQFILEFIDFE